MAAVNGKGRSSNASTRQIRKLLAGGGVSREDSDDELGLEDHPWQWIHSKDPGHGERIIGARMGSFQCKLGDTVLLKAEGTKEAWIGLICDFLLDEEDEKSAQFMWFSSEKEIMNKQKKRTDALANELYITPAWDVNPLATINGKARVLSDRAFRAQYPSGKVPRSSPDHGKIFVCRRGCNTRTATYTEEFVWEEVYQGAQDIDSLVQKVKSGTRATRKRRRVDDDEDHVVDWDDDEKERDPETPRKSRKTTAASTPRLKQGQRTPSKLTTPTHKRIIVKKPLEFTPLGSRVLDPSYLTSSPFQVARSKLHVAAVPATLPCREEAFSTVYAHLEAAISEGSGSCIYISGTPGTGKTATVKEVVMQLNAAVQAEELDDFIFVEINGMKVTDPHQSYSLLWEALQGDRVSPTHALELLEREFGNPSPRRVPCVVLMDELDQLVTKNQSVMYNFFNWPGLRHSRLIVLAVANTMDLPERTLSNKISSRLGLTRITFPGYTHDQLMKIIQSRLEGVPGDIVDPDAVQFASRKVAAVSGDARRALDICRRAVEIAEAEASEEEPNSAQTPSRIGRGKKDGEAARTRKGRVTISTIKQAINEATSSPMQQYLRGLPLSSKLFLAALLAKVRRSGVTECTLGNVIEEARKLSQLTDQESIKENLLTVPPRGVENDRKERRLLAPRVLGLGIASIELSEAGVIGLEARKGERSGKIRLNISDEEVKLALRDDPETRGLGFTN